jgi:carbamoyl-phosphate synthase small subunit
MDLLVNREELEKHPDLEITHYHINDNTVAGNENEIEELFFGTISSGSQSGPHDSSYLFDQFIENIQKDNKI